MAKPALCLLAIVALCGAHGALAVRDQPYTLPDLIPDVIPTDSKDSPPDFLVKAMKLQRGWQYAGNGPIKGAALDVAPIGNLGASLEDEINNPPPPPSPPPAGPNTAPTTAPAMGNATGNNTVQPPDTIDQFKPEIENAAYTHKDMMEMPTRTKIKLKNGKTHIIACGETKKDVPCADNNEARPDFFPTESSVLEQGSVSPNGEPNNIMPSWGSNPSDTLDSTAYGKVHPHFFEEEKGCEADEWTKTYNHVESDIEQEKTRQKQARRNEREHDCVGLVNLVRIQYKELRTKSQTRRRQMCRGNAFPFVQYEKKAEMGPHRRLLQNTAKRRLLQVESQRRGMDGTAIREKQEDLGGISGYDEVQKPDNNTFSNRTHVIKLNPITKQPVPKRNFTFIPMKDLPKIELRHFDDSMKQINTCIRDIKEMLPLMAVIRANLLRDQVPRFCSAVIEAEKAGQPPPEEKTDDGKPGTNFDGKSPSGDSFEDVTAYEEA